MTRFVKDGGKFIVAEGWTPVTDQRTLAGLQGGSIPYETASGQVMSGVKSSPSLSSIDYLDPGTGRPVTGLTGPSPAPAPSPSANVDGSDPLTQFNLAVMEMLKRAQGTAGQENLVAQQTALQRAQIDKVQATTPSELQVLDPSQQAAVRGGQVQSLTTELDAVTNAIKSRNLALSNFENVLGQVRALGQDFIKNISPPDDVIQGYVQMLAAGGNPAAIPAEVMNKVMAKTTPQTWASWQAANAPKGTGTDTSYSYTEQEEIEKGLIDSPEWKNLSVGNVAMGQLNSILNPDRSKIDWNKATTNVSVETAVNSYIRIRNPNISRISASGEALLEDNSVDEAATQLYRQKVEDIGSNPDKLRQLVEATDNQYLSLKAQAQAVRARKAASLQMDPKRGSMYSLPEVPGPVSGAPEDTGSTDPYAGYRSQLQPGEILVLPRFDYGEFRKGQPIAVTQYEYNPMIHQQI